MLHRAVTERGFAVLAFHDRYDQPCMFQASSLASEPAIWLGVADADPQIMAKDAARLGVVTDKEVGWVPYPLPKEVLLSTRMHLTQAMAAAMIPVLQHFVETGELP